MDIKSQSEVEKIHQQADPQTSKTGDISQEKDKQTVLKGSKA